MFDTIPDLQLPNSFKLTEHKVVYTTTIKQEGIPLPSRIHTENWVFSIVFILFILLIISLNRSYHWIVEVPKNLIKANTRTRLFKKTTVEEYQSKLLLTIFATGVINLYFYLDFKEANDLRLSTYLLFLLLSFAYLIVRTQIMNILAYVFFDYERLKTIKSNYFTMFSIVGLLFAPVLLLKMYFYIDIYTNIFNIIALIISLFGLVFITIAAFRIFLHNILDFFHIMLYLCTLEILPLVGMFQLYKVLLKEF